MSSTSLNSLGSKAATNGFASTPPEKKENIVLAAIINANSISASRKEVWRWVAKKNNRVSKDQGVAGLISKPKNEFESIASGDKRKIQSMSDKKDPNLQWAHDEILSCFEKESIPSFIFFDKMGNEILYSRGFDSAFRACLWRIMEDFMEKEILLVAIVHPDVMEIFGDLLNLEKSQVQHFHSFQEFSTWEKQREKQKYRYLGNSSIFSKPAEDLSLSKFVLSSAADSFNIDSHEETQWSINYATFAGRGTMYTLLKIPFLISIVLIILCEVLFYGCIRLTVQMFEYYFRQNKPLYKKLRNATTYKEWYDIATKLDTIELRDSHINVVPLVTQFTERLQSNTYRLQRQSLKIAKARAIKQERMMQRKSHSMQRQVSVEEGSSEYLDARSDDNIDTDDDKELVDVDISVFLQHEHDLVRNLRELALPSFSDLIFDEMLYCHNHTGTNMEMEELAHQIEISIQTIHKADPAALLWNYLKKRHCAQTDNIGLDDIMTGTDSEFEHDEGDIKEKAKDKRLAFDRKESLQSKHLMELIEGNDTFDQIAQNDEAFFALGKAYKALLVAELAHSFGKSSLCLSGGASNAYHHLGVMEALIAKDLLPKHISGASGGALTGSFLCTHTDEELKQLLNSGYLSKIFNPNSDSVYVSLMRMLQKGHIFDAEEWKMKLKNQICGDATFKEAYEKTGRSFTITVFNIMNGKQHTRALNYKTTPDVVIFSAVLASAAIPGVLPKIELQYKDSKGKIVPYVALGRFWRDGSFENELPFEALHHMFNATFNIVSQVEPHIAPFFFSNRGSAGLGVAHRGGEGWKGGFVLAYCERLVKLDLRKWMELIREFHLLPRIVDTDFSGVFLGRTYGTVTLTVPFKFRNYFYLISDPNTPEKMAVYMDTGRQMAYPKMGMIQDRAVIERIFSEAVSFYQEN